MGLPFHAAEFDPILLIHDYPHSRSLLHQFYQLGRHYCPSLYWFAKLLAALQRYSLYHRIKKYRESLHLGLLPRFIDHNLGLLVQWGDHEGDHLGVFGKHQHDHIARRAGRIGRICPALGGELIAVELCHILLAVAGDQRQHPASALYCGAFDIRVVGHIREARGLRTLGHAAVRS